jgi:excisionase family DNA binding protein
MLWTAKQVAKYLNISNSMVYKLVSNKVIPCVRLSDCIRFNPETIVTLAKESRNKTIQLISTIT